MPGWGEATDLPEEARGCAESSPAERESLWRGAVTSFFLARGYWVFPTRLSGQCGLGVLVVQQRGRQSLRPMPGLGPPD